MVKIKGWREVAKISRWRKAGKNTWYLSGFYGKRSVKCGPRRIVEIQIRKGEFPGEFMGIMYNQEGKFLGVIKYGSRTEVVNAVEDAIRRFPHG